MVEVSLLVAVWNTDCPDYVRGVATALCTRGLFWKVLKLLLGFLGGCR